MQHTVAFGVIGVICILIPRAAEGQAGMAALQFAPGQEHTDAMLGAVRTQTSHMFQALGRAANLSASEDLHAMKFSVPGGFDSDWRGVFRYAVETSKAGDPESLDEVRTGPNGEVKSAPGKFVVTRDFLWLLECMLPRYRPRMRFRYLGRDRRGDTDVVVFAGQFEAAELPHWAEIANDDGPVLFQGFIWIDAAANRITRIRAESLPAAKSSPLQKITTDARFGVLEFKSNDAALWVPSRVTVTVRGHGLEYYNVHRFSGYRVFAGGRLDAGISRDKTADEPDAREAMVEGIVLLRNRQPAQAVTKLREAVRLDPNAAEPRYHLGTALHETHDLAGAEAELREVVKRIPDAADGHRELGTVLFERGDPAGAAAEFRELIRLDPADAAAHANLGEALVKLHDPRAVEEYRTASKLAPGNAAVKARLETVSQAATASATRIQVEVRQVIVPVVVSDTNGHQVTGLRQADFHVFEDGIEQTLSSFSEEHSEIPAAPDGPATAPERAQKAPAVTAAAASPLHTYLICVDTLHASPGDFAQVREALMKLFAREEPGHAQYALINLGRQAEIVRQLTPDPSQVLSALESAKFLGAAVGSDASSNHMAVEEFRQFLEETRIACEASDPTEQMKCKARLDLLPAQAEYLAQRNVPTTIAFLETLERVVEQFPGTPTRGELILISDGFLLNSASESFGLLAAYFPDAYQYPGIRAAGLRARDDRFQGGFDSIVRAAARRNVRIHTIDSRGLYVSENFAASSRGSVTSRDPAVMSYTDDLSRESGNSLAEIAAATGGIFVHDTNDLLAGMRRVLADGRDYYILSYVSKNGNMDGKFRAITIKVRDAKLTVRSKRGYWATAE